MEEPTPTYTELRHQILANATQLFPDLVEQHLTHHESDNVRAEDTFNIITVTDVEDLGCLCAVLTYGDATAWKVAATGYPFDGVEAALLGLLKVLSAGLSKAMESRIESEPFTYPLQGGHINHATLPEDTTLL